MANHWGVRDIEGKNLVEIDTCVKGAVEIDLKKKEPNVDIELDIIKGGEDAFWEDRYYKITIGEASVDLWLTEDGNLEGRHRSPWSVHWWACGILGRRLAMGLDGTYWDGGTGEADVNDEDEILHKDYEDWIEDSEHWSQHPNVINYGHRS